jgi:hypothetical protein
MAHCAECPDEVPEEAGEIGRTKFGFRPESRKNAVELTHFLPPLPK